MKKKRNLGITLIALVITIVVLLILAGISLNLVLGENGIVTKAKDAREQTIIGHEKEQINLAYSACKTRENFDDLVTASELETEMKKSNENVSVAADGDNLVITFEETKHQYNIGQDGNYIENVDWSKLEPGLYKTGTSEMIKSWQELIDDKLIDVEDSKWVVKFSSKLEDVEGDLVISSDIDEIVKSAPCAFWYQPKITGIYFPERLTNIEENSEISQWLPYLKKIDVAKDNKDYSADNGVLYDKNKTKMLWYPGCRKEAKYIVPASVTYIGEDAIGLGTNSLKEIVFEGSLEIGQGAFCGCENLNKIEFKNSVTIGEGAFERCKNISDIIGAENIEDIASYELLDTEWAKKQPEGDIYLGKILLGHAGEMHSNTCIQVKDGTKRIKLVGNDTSSVSSVIIPSSVVDIASVAFGPCESLEKIEVAENNQYYTVEDGILFDSDKKTLKIYPRKKIDTSYVIPGSVITIDIWAFAYCTNLNNITIPNSVTKIDYEAFSNCTNLTTVRIPNSVTELGYDAFSECKNIKVTVEAGSSLTEDNLRAAGLDNTQFEFEK